MPSLHCISRELQGCKNSLFSLVKPESHEGMGWTGPRPSTIPSKWRSATSPTFACTTDTRSLRSLTASSASNDAVLKVVSVRNNAYKLAQPPKWAIHDLTSVEHLEPHPRKDDPYDRQMHFDIPTTIDEHNPGELMYIGYPQELVLWLRPNSPALACPMDMVAWNLRVSPNATLSDPRRAFSRSWCNTNLDLRQYGDVSAKTPNGSSPSSSGKSEGQWFTERLKVSHTRYHIGVSFLDKRWLREPIAIGLLTTV